MKRYVTLSPSRRSNKPFIGRTINLILPLLAVFLMISTGARAQYPTATSFPFWAEAKTYNYLSGGTSVSLQADDITVSNIPVGFSFTFCGSNYTTVSACSNGWLALGNTSSTYYSNSKNNAGNIAPVLMPIFDDLQGVGSTTSYKTTGNPGSRIFTFEWRNTRPLSATSNPEISMQVKLYEGLNAIEFLYKREGSASFSSATIGIMGNTNADFQTLDNSSASPTISTSSFVTNIKTKPATGQSYVWGDLRNGYNNAGAGDIITPAAKFCANATVPIKVSIKNNGLNKINNVEVHWLVDNIAQPTVNWSSVIDTMHSSAGNSAEVPLGNVTFGSTAKAIRIYTSLPNGVADTVNGDDTLDVILRPGLEGVYTVGANGDFSTVVDAADALNKFGICGPVTMNILNGTYTGQVKLDNIDGADAANRITFQSQTGNASGVTINTNTVGPGDVFEFNNSSYVTLKNVTIASNVVNQGYVVNLVGGSSSDSIIGCVVNSMSASTSSQTAGIYADDLTGTDNVIMNNTVNYGYYGIHVMGSGSSSSSLTKDHIIQGNTINDAYRYSVYVYYTSNLKVRNNVIKGLSSTDTHYGMYTRYCDAGLEISGNEIVLTGNATKYGMYMYYCDGNSSNNNNIVNNTVAIDCGSSSGYGIYNYYSKYQNYINNSSSVNSSSTSSNAARFYYSSSTYGHNNIVNNAFSNVTGTGFTMYLYNGNNSYNNYWDYNNIHSGTNKLVETSSPSSSYTTLAAWNNAYNMDMHSISYDPGFTSLTDLHPNTNNPACWSLNGRGLHIVSNNVDKDNNPRVEYRPDGVPDIGAYEFDPETTPPVATATPSTADPGDTQVFTFGQREVATVKWGNKQPIAPLEIRQYSGEKGQGIATAASPFGSMYFHTDIKTLGLSNTYDFDLKVDYMDIWLGNINNEGDLRMAQKAPNFNWTVYNDVLSTVNTTTNILDAPSVNLLGSFTGLENGSIPSAFVRTVNGSVFCLGDKLQLKAEPQNGTFYKWYFNNNPIPGAEGATYTTLNATQAGNYSVNVTQGGKIVESAPLSISSVAAPNAVITASGPLTYCTGNGLTLNAGNVSGLTYQWQLDGTNIPGANNNTYPVAQAGKYTVMVQNIGCTAVSTITQVNAGPLSVDLGSDINVCERKNIFAKLDAGYPGARYSWSTGDTTQVIEARRSGNYWVRVDAGPGCIDQDTINVKIDPLPYANGISFVQNGNNYQFYASGVRDATGYMWIFGDGSTSTMQSPSKTINDGNLYVRLIMFNACGTDTVQLGWPQSVSNVDNQQGISVYPNPANDHINVKVSGDMEVAEIAVLNSVGAVVQRVADVHGNQATVNVSQLPAGHYILYARSSNGMISKQFDIIR